MANNTHKLTVTVIGFGTMGQGIAQNFAETGMSVRVVDRNPDAWPAGRKQILANLKIAHSHLSLIHI